MQYDRFLKLCGFSDDDIKQEKPRIDKAFEKAEIGPEDISRGEERIKKYFDIELPSIRKMLGIWIKEFADMSLAKEDGKTIVYPIYPSISQFGISLMMASEDLYVTTPEVVIDVVLGGIFDKINPILEAAEQNGLGPGLAHCSLLQARLGSIVKGIAPMPDLTMTTGFYCDQAPKTDELLHELYGVTNIFINRSMDPNWDEWPDMTERQVRFFGEEVRSSIEQFGEITGFKLTEEAFREGFRENAKRWFAFQDVQNLMRNEPQPISQNDLTTLTFYMLISPTRRFIKEGPEALQLLYKDVKDRVERGVGVVGKGAPRVTMELPSFTDPSFAYLIEKELGLSIPLCVMTWLTPRELTKDERFKDRGERIALGMLRRGCFHSAIGRADYYREIAEAWNLDGVIYNYLFSCRPVCLTAQIVKKYVERELGIPVLALEYDLYDSRDYSAEQVRTRVETFAEMLKVRKAAKA